MLRISIDDFATAFGVSPKELPEECKEQISKFDFRFEPVSQEDRDRLLLETLEKLDGDDLTAAGSHRKGIWEKGWAENYSEFVKSDYDLKSLLPKYFRTELSLRFKQRYIRPVDPDFEVNFFAVLKTWLFRSYLTDIPNVYEVGCGTGVHLVTLAQMFPQKRLFGLDWAAASQDILKAIATKYGWPIEGRHFDIFNPDPELDLMPDSAVLTIHSLEQIGDGIRPLLDYLLRQKPKICISVEPLVELYDPSNLMDYLAIKYHRKRAYLENYLTALRRLEEKKRVKIIAVQRPFISGFFNESYSVVVWKPVQQSAPA